MEVAEAPIELPAPDEIAATHTAEPVAPLALPPSYEGALTHIDSSPARNRIVFDIADRDYRRAPGVSNSQLKGMKPTPMHFRYNILNPQRDRHALNIGKVFHLAIFEPDKFGLGKSHVVRPDEFKDYRSNAAKSWRDSQTLPILSPGEIKENAGMAEAIRANKIARAWLDNIRTEVALWAHHPETGLLRKGKLDGLVETEPVILDVKTSENAAAFETHAGEFYYFQQEAYYRDLCDTNGVEIARFIFIVVEKSAPHGVRLVELTAEDVQRGRDIYRNNLERLARCIAADDWPGYPAEPRTIELKRYARDRIELEALAV